MKELLSLKVSGLFTYADKFSAVPEGSMSIANNIVIDQTNLFSPRRGFAALSTSGLVSNQLNNIAGLQYFNGKLTLLSSDTSVGTVSSYNANSNLWTNYTLKDFGTPVKYVKPTGTAAIRTTNGNKNVYLTTSEGIKKTFDGSEMESAGVPPGFSPTLTLTTTQPGALLPAGSSAAYRTVFGYKDYNKNLIFGAPSSAVIITNNTAVDKNVTVTQITPNTNKYPVDSSWFVRIFRTEIATNSTEPGDEMYLVTEINFTNTPVSIVYEDLQPDDLLTTPLYTNANQEGIQSANGAPPPAKDLALFNGYTFYGNITNRAKSTTQLLSTGRAGSVTDALATGDQLSFVDDAGSPYSITGKYRFKFQGDIPTGATNGGAATNNNVLTDVSTYLTDVMATSSLSSRTITSQYLNASYTPNYDSGITFTVTIASPAVVTHTCDGLKTGDKVRLKTTGSLPTGLTINTDYYVKTVTATTCNLAISYANALAGTVITTTGSQSGVHSLSGIVKVDNASWILPTGTCRKTRSAESVSEGGTTATWGVSDAHKFSVGQNVRIGSTDYEIISVNITTNKITFTNTIPGGTYTMYYYDLMAGWSAGTTPGTSLVLEDVNEALFENLKVQDKIKLTGDTTVYTIVTLNAIDRTITLDTAVTSTLAINSLTAITVYPQNVEFEVSEASTSSNFQISVSVFAARDVEETAVSIAATLNALNKPITAYYASTPETLPGLIEFTEVFLNATFEPGSGSFTVNFPVNTGFAKSGTINAEREEETNSAYYSKFQQPEHVPIKNKVQIGSAGTVIRRIIPLRTALLFFTNDGIYRLTGNTESAFQVTLLDNTALLLADNSLTVLNNAAIGLFDQGVCQISETVNIISRPIEDILLRARNQTTDDQLNNLTFGIGYQSDRKYLLSLPTSVTEVDNGTGSLILVFNILNQTWTSWDRKEKAACLGYGDKLFVASEGKISEERKNFDDSDIADEQILLSVTPEIYGKTTYAATAFDAATYYIEYPGIDLGLKVNSRFSLDFGTGTHYSVFVDSIVVNTGTNTTTITLNAPVYSTFPTVLSGSCDILTYPDYSELYINLADYPKVRVGDILWTHNERFSRVSAVNPDRSTINVLTPVWFTDYEFTEIAITGGDVGVPTILPYIDVVVEWNPITAGSPTSLKHFSEATLITTSAIQQPIMGFRGATNPSVTYVEFGSTSIGNFGMFPWGNNPWGGEPALLRYRTFVPADNQRDSMLIPRFEQKTSYNNFECSGLSVSYRQLGSRVVR